MLPKSLNTRMPKSPICREQAAFGALWPVLLRRAGEQPRRRHGCRPHDLRQARGGVEDFGLRARRRRDHREPDRIAGQIIGCDRPEHGQDRRVVLQQQPVLERLERVIDRQRRPYGRAAGAGASINSCALRTSRGISS